MAGWRPVLFIFGLLLCVQTAAGRSLLQGSRGSIEPSPKNGRPAGITPPGQASKNGEDTLTADDPFADHVELVEDELIVVFKPGTREARKGLALGKGKATAKNKLRSDDGVSAGDMTLVSVQISSNANSKTAQRQELKAAAAAILSDANVEHAQPNFVYRSLQAVQTPQGSGSTTGGDQTTPGPTTGSSEDPSSSNSGTTNDPNLSMLWGMAASGGGANATGAWAMGFTGCSDVVIGVVDTGIQTSHPDLAAHIWFNPGEIPSNGVDDDGNGRVDDINGFDFLNSDAVVFDDVYDDHGTHVAGTMGAVGNNALGVVGVCQSGLRIISAKCFGGPDGTGTTAGVTAAMAYLLDIRTRYSLNMVATSHSWAGGVYDTLLFNAIRSHRDAGILFIAAAGNEARNNDVTTSYPSGYDLSNVVAVGAITSTGAISSFSNWGASQVDLFAPGTTITSTWPINVFSTISGTSMAVPHVTGAVALYAAAARQATGSTPSAASIKAAVMNTGTPNSAYTGACVSGRRLNIGNLLATVVRLGPSPSPSPSPSPAPPKKKMFVRLVNRIFYDSGWFYCRIQISGLDAVTLLPISNLVVTGVHSITPDIDWWTDWYADNPLSMSASFGAATSATTSSDWIPRRSTIQTWPDAASVLPANYQGAACVFRVVLLTHPDYELQTGSSAYPTTISSTPQ